MAEHPRAYEFPIQFKDLFEQDKQRLLQEIQGAFNINGNDNLRLNLQVPTENSQNQDVLKVTISRNIKLRDVDLCKPVFGKLKEALAQYSEAGDLRKVSLDDVLDFVSEELDKVRETKRRNETHSVTFCPSDNSDVQITIVSSNSKEPEQLQGIFSTALERRAAGNQKKEAEQQAIIEAQGAYNPEENILIGSKLISGKTDGQRHLISELNDPHASVVLVDGPAGSGKTFLAVAKATAELMDRDDVERIILLRPAFDAGGETMAAVPGNGEEKIAGYMAPLVENLIEVMGHDDYKNNKRRRLIQILPVAYARGLTFKNAVVVIDEAQNAADLPLLLGRIGENCRYVVVGDRKQSDLPRDVQENMKHSFAQVVDYYEDLGNRRKNNEVMSEDDTLRAQFIRVVKLAAADSAARSPLCRLLIGGFDEMERLAEPDIAEETSPAVIDAQPN